MYAQKVRDFTSACEQHLPQTPKPMDQQQIRFVSQMVMDELEELKQSNTIAEQADALVDAIYYLCDSAVRHGINLDPLFDIVHDANMKKVVDGKVLKRSDGKIMKPKTWEDPKPLLEREVERQRDEGAFKGQLRFGK